MSELVKMCKEQFGWERTTTYTVISRLKERGVVNTENSVVTSIVSQAEAEIAAIDEVVDKVFSGSMPSFFAAFVRRAELSEEDQAKFAQLIDTYGEQ